MSLNSVPIGQLHINLKSRDAPTKIALALMEIYGTPAYNEALFDILERYIVSPEQVHLEIHYLVIDLCNQKGL